MRYVALLRGINVGGNNIIKMADLKTCFEDHGYLEVLTYIQSGNVIFESRGSATKLTQDIEAMLSKTFSYKASVVLRSRAQIRKVVAGAPKGFGTQSDKYRYDVLFLKPPLTATKAVKEVPLKEGVDEVATGPGVLYHWRLASRASSSRLSRVASMPIYKNMTIRNWNTTEKLLQLMDDR